MLTSNINIYTKKTNYQNSKLRVIKDLKRFKDLVKILKICLTHKNPLRRIIAINQVFRGLQELIRRKSMISKEKIFLFSIFSFIYHINGHKSF